MTKRRRKKPNKEAITKKDEAQLKKFIKTASIITLIVVVILYFIYNGF